MHADTQTLVYNNTTQQQYIATCVYTYSLTVYGNLTFACIRLSTATL